MKSGLKNSLRLAGLAGIGCAACCAPLMVPAVLAVLGGSALLSGIWAVAGLAVLGVAYYVIKRRKKGCDCPTPTKGN